MATSNTESTFSPGSVERLLDEFRGTDSAVRALFRVHRGIVDAETLTVETVEDAIHTLNEQVVLTLDRGEQHTEHLYFKTGDDGGWYSLTETATSTVGPIALYQHNVADRLESGYPVTAARTDATPFAGIELAPHGLDPDADGVVLDD